MTHRFLLPSAACLLAALLYVSPAFAGDWHDLLARAPSAPAKEFHYGTAPDQFAQLWLPEGKGPFPVIAMIHGGCWQESLPGVELMAPLAEDLRKRGVAVWNIEYRRLGADGGGYPGTFLDIGDALDALQHIGVDYGLDLAHVVTLGHSAGGQLALWAAARGRFKPGDPLYRKHPQKISAAITLAGIDDLAAYREAGPSACGGPDTIDALAAGDKEPAYGDISPAALVPLRVPQLIVSGANDDIVPPFFGRSYAAAAVKAGDKADALEMPGADHFDLIDPQSKAWEQISARLLPYLK